MSSMPSPHTEIMSPDLSPTQQGSAIIQPMAETDAVVDAQHPTTSPATPVCREPSVPAGTGEKGRRDERHARAGVEGTKVASTGIQCKCQNRNVKTVLGKMLS